MPFPNPDTQFKPGESGNPAGKPKGTKHLSTHIQDMLDDEDFDTLLQHPTKGYIEFKGKPITAIIQVAIRKAQAGDNKWADWLAKYGYGEKYTVDQNISGQLDTGIQDPQLAKEFTDYLKQKKD